MALKVPIYYDYRSTYSYLLAVTWPLAELESKHDVVFEWRPFELRPQGQPLPSPDFWKNERVVRSWNYFQALAKQNRLPVASERPPNIWTRKAMAATECARMEGKFDQFHKAVYKAYFERKLNINDKQVLLDIGKSVGLDCDLLADSLDSGRLEGLVEEYRSRALKQGVFGVPTVVIGGKRIWGREPYDDIRNALEEMRR